MYLDVEVDVEVPRWYLHGCRNTQSQSVHSSRHQLQYHCMCVHMHVRMYACMHTGNTGHGPHTPHTAQSPVHVLLQVVLCVGAAAMHEHSLCHPPVVLMCRCSPGEFGWPLTCGPAAAEGGGVGR